MIAGVLARAMVARLGTVSRTGRPHVNPIYFVVVGGRMWMGTTSTTLAARNVAATGVAQVLLEVEEDPADRRMVRIDGRARLVHEPAVLRRYKRLDARKYFRSARGVRMAVTHLRQLYLTSRYLSSARTGATHCVIEVTPTNFTTVDRVV